MVASGIPRKRRLLRLLWFSLSFSCNCTSIRWRRMAWWSDSRVVEHANSVTRSSTVTTWWRSCSSRERACMMDADMASRSCLVGRPTTISRKATSGSPSAPNVGPLTGCESEQGRAGETMGDSRQFTCLAASPATGTPGWDAFLLVVAVVVVFTRGGAILAAGDGAGCCQ